MIGAEQPPQAVQQITTSHGQDQVKVDISVKVCPKSRKVSE